MLLVLLKPNLNDYIINTYTYNFNKYFNMALIYRFGVLVAHIPSSCIKA